MKSLIIFFILTVVLLFSCTKKRAEFETRSNFTEFLHASSVPRRIVSLAPNLTEIIFLLGHGRSVVGVTRFDTYPPEVKKIKKIGGFIDVSFERIVELDPDLVFMTTNSSNFNTFKALKKRNIRVYYTRIDGLDDIFRTIKEVGAILHEEEKALKVIGRMKHEIDLLKGKNFQKNRKKVLMIVGYYPLVAVGSRSYLNEILEIAGGENVLKNAPVAYSVISKESLSNLKIDAVFDLTMGNGSTPVDFLSFLKNRGIRLKKFSEPFFTVPGPRIIKVIESFSNFLHH